MELTEPNDLIELTEESDLIGFEVHDLGWYSRSGYGIMKDYDYDYNI